MSNILLHKGEVCVGQKVCLINIIELTIIDMSSYRNFFFFFSFYTGKASWIVFTCLCFVQNWHLKKNTLLSSDTFNKPGDWSCRT